jgi:glyoxylase-like metal-dependent hydrolase (beta-lactamase superfamily II)
MKIADGVHALMQEKGGRVHAFLLDDGEAVTLIDALFDTDGALVLDELRDMGRTAADLKHIIITHAHRSHIGSVAALKQLTGATVYAHEQEAEILAGVRKATRVSIWPKPPREVYKLQVGLALGLGKHPPCQADQSIREGEKIGPLSVIHTPGHTPGCLSFWWKERRALFVGDAVVTWPKVEAGWAGLTLDMKENIRSVGKLSEVGDVEILGVGHGPPIRNEGLEVLKKLREQKAE